MIGTGCTESTTTSQGRVLFCCRSQSDSCGASRTEEAWILGGWASSSPVGSSWRTVRCLREFVLPPASAWVFRNGSLEQKKPISIHKNGKNRNTLDPEESYYQELREIFSRKTSLGTLMASARIGMSLTGGLDTRMIMAWQEAEPGSLPCYTFGGMFRECQDVHWRAGGQLRAAIMN